MPRPDGELQKLEWRDIDLTDKVVTIRPEVSKTNRRRFIDLSDNAKAWLQAFINRSGAPSGRVVTYSESELRARSRSELESGRNRTMDSTRYAS
jgi:integrase